MMNGINLKINEENIQVPGGTTILDACKKLNIKIPTLCNFTVANTSIDIAPGSCRVCVVEVEGFEKLFPACSTKVWEGMEVKTHSMKAIKARRNIVELILSNHPKDCLICPKNGNCELQQLAAELEIREIKYTEEIPGYQKDISNKSIVRDMNKCILCRRCVDMCNNVQTVNVLSAVDRGFKTTIAPAFKKSLSDTSCTFCGQCVAVCPTGALTAVNVIPEVWNALEKEDYHVVVQTAPAVRVALGEAFGLEPGTDVTGKMVTALKKMGFDRVFDTNFTADLTIIEEATELLHRIKNNGRLPILTSCCPGWVKFIEHQFPELLDVPSTCKSPQQMFGAIIKTYYAEKMNIPAEKIRVVSIMPCLSKKYEASRSEMNSSGYTDVDFVLSTRELALMIKEAGIDFTNLEDKGFDEPLGESTGAADIFGSSGGVLEAAVRTAADILTGDNLKAIDYQVLRGIEGVKEAEVEVAGLTLRLAVVNGLGNARKLLECIKDGKCNYHAIEIMACPGGCIGGGGQPYHHGNGEILMKRSKGLYSIDAHKQVRKSHENASVKKLYEEFLGEPYYSEKSHELLHTSYTGRGKS